MATSHSEAQNRITVTVEMDDNQPVSAAEPQHGPDVDVPLEDAIAAVDSPRRRAAIQTIHTTGGEITLSALVGALASQEYDDPDSQERKRVWVSLYQTHLPHLDNLGVVSFDDEANVITATDALSGLVSWLDDSRQRFGGGDA